MSFFGIGVAHLKRMYRKLLVLDFYLSTLNRTTSKEIHVIFRAR